MDLSDYRLRDDDDEDVSIQTIGLMHMKYVTRVELSKLLN
jgi:hypothetical protein